MKNTEKRVNGVGVMRFSTAEKCVVWQSFQAISIHAIEFYHFFLSVFFFSLSLF